MRCGNVDDDHKMEWAIGTKPWWFFCNNLSIRWTFHTFCQFSQTEINHWNRLSQDIIHNQCVYFSSKPFSVWVSTTCSFFGIVWFFSLDEFSLYISAPTMIWIEKLNCCRRVNKENAQNVSYLYKINTTKTSQRHRIEFLVGRRDWTCAVSDVSDCSSGNKNSTQPTQEPQAKWHQEHNQHHQLKLHPLITTGRLKFIDGNCNPHIRWWWRCCDVAIERSLLSFSMFIFVSTIWFSSSQLMHFNHITKDRFIFYIKLSYAFCSLFTQSRGLGLCFHFLSQTPPIQSCDNSCNKCLENSSIAWGKMKLYMYEVM